MKDPTKYFPALMISFNFMVPLMFVGDSGMILAYCIV